MSTVNIRLAPSAAALAVCLLSGCTSQGGSSDDQMARFLVAPGRYVLYTCDEMARQAQVSAVREKELERLMIKAGADAGGQAIGVVAYKTEYIALRGDLIELRRASAEKNCNPLPDPGNPSGRVSDSVIR